MNQENKKTKICKKCKEVIENDLKYCSKCGAKQKMPIWVIPVIVISIIFVLFIFIPEDNTNSSDNSSYNSNSQNTSTNSEETNNPNNNNYKELSESDKMISKISALIDENLAFDTGNYIKGDIPAGEYAFVKFNGSGSYYCEKDASGSIVDNENFDSFGYVQVHSVGNLETRGVLINISAFEKLGVSGAKQIYEILNDQTDYSQAGYYKVGNDIEAGTYTIESMGRGYYAILSGPVSNNDIIDNDNFNGKAQVTISNGQYLELSRSQISQ